MKNISIIKTTFVIILGISISSYSFSMKLGDAIAQKKIEVDAKWAYNNSGEPLSLKIKNLSGVSIEIEVGAGSHFRCLDDAAQDMLAMKNYHYTIAANKSMTKTLKVHCMEKHDYGPHQDAEFVYMGNADEKLLAVANFVASTDKYAGISQSLVWALAEKQPVFNYSKGDSVAYWPLFSKVSSFIQIEPYKPGMYDNYTFIPIPRYTYSSRVNMSSYIKPNTSLSLIGFDKDGEVLKEYYKNKPVPAGFYNVTIGYNEIVTDSNFSVTYKLTDNSGTVLLEKKAANNTMEPAEKIFWLKTSWEINVENPIAKASLKLFGPDEKPLLTLYEHKNLPAGIRKTPYAFYHTYGKQSKFKVRLYDEATSSIVKEIEIDGASSEEQIVKMTKKQ